MHKGWLIGGKGLRESDNLGAQGGWETYKWSLILNEMIDQMEFYNHFHFYQGNICTKLNTQIPATQFDDY